MAHKRTKRLAVLLALLCAVALPATALGELYGIVHGGNLRMRTAPSRNAGVEKLYPNGTWVEILEEENEFYYVLAEDGRYGYMSVAYLTTDDGQLGTWATVENGSKYVNMRSGPSSTSRTIGRVYTGTRVEVLDYGTVYAYCRVNGNTLCYLSNGLLRLDGQQVWEEMTVHADGGARLRTGPSTRYDRIRTVPNGGKVTVLIEGNRWHKVSYKGEVGFMSAEYLSLPGKSNSQSGWSIGTGVTLP